MAASNGLHIAIANWRFRVSAPVAEQGRLERFLKSFAGSRVPAYRDVGIVDAWVVPVDADTFTTITFYSSDAGMHEGIASLPESGNMHGGIYDQVDAVAARFGPATDIFHLGAHSSLQAIEQRARSHPDDEEKQRFASIATWRIRDDAGVWPDGSDPAEIPPGALYSRFLGAAADKILVQPEAHGMIGGWSIDAGDGVITFLSLYMDAEGMAGAWAEVSAEGGLGVEVHRYLEPIDRIAGPVIDLIMLGTEYPESTEAAGESGR